MFSDYIAVLGMLNFAIFDTSGLDWGRNEIMWGIDTFLLWKRHHMQFFTLICVNFIRCYHIVNIRFSIRVLRVEFNTSLSGGPRGLPVVSK